MTDPDPANPTHPLNERLWEQGWEGHDQAQRRRMASLTLAQKLEWLEEAQRLVEQLNSARRRGSERERIGPGE